MRRLRNGQLYSAGLTRLGIAALLGVGWGPTLIGRCKGRVVRDVSYHSPLGFARASPVGFRVPTDHSSLAARPLPAVTKVPLECVSVGGPPKRLVEWAERAFMHGQLRPVDT